MQKITLVENLNLFISLLFRELNNFYICKFFNVKLADFVMKSILKYKYFFFYFMLVSYLNTFHFSEY